ncbi:hypothetical protein [Sphingobacterium sp. UBA6645]|uniref:hypothetical protein n=1 Tax=Sphingobacterium sp. UBA6645 TaxID=1947511 RepID=UPI0025E9A109|nr:hypothetical protein [Sphingobacterium sp. UBA6645]
MKRGYKLLLVAFVVCALTSCGVLRNKSKQSAKLEVSEGAKIERTELEKSASSVVVQEREIDRGTTVTERETTTVTTKEGSKGKIIIKKDDLTHGENFLRDSAVGMVKAILDTLNKTLSIEFDTPSSRTETTVKETITEKRDETKERQQERKDTANKQVAVQAEQSRKESSSASQSESKPNVWAILMNNIGLGVAFLIILITLVWWLLKIKKR